MIAEKGNPTQRRIEAGERYVNALIELGANPEVIEAAKRAANMPSFEERKRLMKEGKIRRKAIFFERLSRRARKIG
jgi:hypothetical protein